MKTNFIENHKYIKNHFEKCGNDLKLFKDYDSTDVFLAQVLTSYFSIFESSLKNVFSKEEMILMLKNNGENVGRKTTYLSILRRFLGWYVDEIKTNSNDLKNFEAIIETSCNSSLIIDWTSFYQEYINVPRNLVVHDFTLANTLKNKEKIEWFIPKLIEIFFAIEKILSVAKKINKWYEVI